jgi:hypothetical protein
MTNELPRALDFVRANHVEGSEGSDDTTPHFALTSLGQAIGRYKDTMKDEIDLLFADEANQKTEEVVNGLTQLYDDVFDLAIQNGSSSSELQHINSFIEWEMTSLVHDFAKYFDNKSKEFEIFATLLSARRNEAIWCEVFTFYLHFDKLNNSSPPSALALVDHFWKCYQIDQEAKRLGKDLPYFHHRLSKVFERIYNGASYGHPGFVQLFERYSGEVAENSSSERQEMIRKELLVHRRMFGLATGVR